MYLSAKGQRRANKQYFSPLQYHEKPHSVVLRALQILKVLFNCQRKVTFNEKDELLSGPKPLSKDSWASINKSLVSLASTPRLWNRDGPPCPPYRSVYGIVDCARGFAKLIHCARSPSVFPAPSTPTGLWASHRAATLILGPKLNTELPGS